MQRDTLEIWDPAWHRRAGGGARASDGTSAAPTSASASSSSVHLPGDDDDHFPPFVNISQTEPRVCSGAAWGSAADRPALGPRRRAATRTTTGCNAAGRPAGPRRLTAAYACLGRVASTGGAAGTGIRGEAPEDQFLICDVRAGCPWEERRFYFDPVWNPGRQVLVHPCPGDLADRLAGPARPMSRRSAPPARWTGASARSSATGRTSCWVIAYRFHALAPRFASAGYCSPAMAPTCWPPSGPGA